MKCIEVVKFSVRMERFELYLECLLSSFDTPISVDIDKTVKLFLQIPVEQVFHKYNTNQIEDLSKHRVNMCSTETCVVVTSKDMISSKICTYSLQFVFNRSRESLTPSSNFFKAPFQCNSWCLSRRMGCPKTTTNITFSFLKIWACHYVIIDLQNMTQNFSSKRRILPLQCASLYIWRSKHDSERFIQMENFTTSMRFIVYSLKIISSAPGY